MASRVLHFVNKAVSKRLYEPNFKTIQMLYDYNTIPNIFLVLPRGTVK